MRKAKDIEGTIVLNAGRVSSGWASQWLLEAIVNLNSTYREAGLAWDKKNIRLEFYKCAGREYSRPRKGVLAPLDTNVGDRIHEMGISGFEMSKWIHQGEHEISQFEDKLNDFRERQNPERNHNFSDLNPKWREFFLFERPRSGPSKRANDVPIWTRAQRIIASASAQKGRDQNFSDLNLKMTKVFFSFFFKIFFFLKNFFLRFFLTIKRQESTHRLPSPVLWNHNW